MVINVTKWEIFEPYFQETGGRSRQKNHSNYIAQKLTAHINLVWSSRPMDSSNGILAASFLGAESSFCLEISGKLCPAKVITIRLFSALLVFLFRAVIDPTVYLVNSQPQGREKVDMFGFNLAASGHCVCDFFSAPSQTSTTWTGAYVIGKLCEKALLRQFPSY